MTSYLLSVWCSVTMAFKECTTAPRQFTIFPDKENGKNAIIIFKII